MTTFTEAVAILTERDRDLAEVVSKYGQPTPWVREPGFATLIRTILGQQVSLAAAESTFSRLQKLLGQVTPENLLEVGDDSLREIGFSRQKTVYAQELAKAIANQELDLASLASLDDKAVRQQLIKIKGIGDWTVDMYLMMALQRLDVFPVKDLAVKIAVQELKGLATRPQSQELMAIAAVWQPYRAIATMILWHYYLNRK